MHTIALNNKMRRNKSESQLNDSPNGKDFSDGDNSDESKDFVGLNSDDDRRTSFDDHTSDATFTLEQAIEEIGMGKMQWRLLCICGGWWGCDAIEIMLLSFLIPLLEKEWELNPVLSALVASATFFGAFVGTFIWGTLSDRAGRRWGYLATTVFTSVFGLASAFSPNLVVLIILRALLGVGIGGTPVAFSMFSEFLPIKGRGKYLVAFEVLWTVGILFEAFLAWLILPYLSWRWLIAISAIPLWLMLLCYPLVPESPRFLMISGQRTKAMEVLRYIAGVNGTKLPPGTLAMSEIKEERGKFKDLVASPSLRVLSILLWGLWFMNSISYYGNVLFTPTYFGNTLGLDDPENSGSIYLYTFITTLFELPGLLVSAILIDRIGRKKTMSSMLIGCGVCTFGLLFSPPTVVGILLLSLGRLFIEASYASLWTYTPESYPTTLRATGLGVCNGFAKAASVVTPFISTAILNTSITLPVLIFTGFSIAGAICSWALPFETKERGMQDSVAAPYGEGLIGSGDIASELGLITKEQFDNDDEESNAYPLN